MEDSHVEIYKQARMERNMMLSLIGTSIMCILFAPMVGGVGSLASGYWGLITWIPAGFLVVCVPWVFWSKPIRYEVSREAILIVRRRPFSGIVVPLDSVHDVVRLHPKRDYTLREAIDNLEGAGQVPAPPQSVFPLPPSTRERSPEMPEYLCLRDLTTGSIRPPRPSRMKVLSLITDTGCVVLIAGDRNYAISPEHPDAFVEDVRRQSIH